MRIVVRRAGNRTVNEEGGDCFVRSIPALIYPDMRLCPVRRNPLLDELVTWKPDVIHLHTEASISRITRKIAAKTCAPLLMTAHTDYAQYAFGRFRNAFPVRLLMKTLGRMTYRPVTAVIVPSEKAKGFAVLQPVIT